MRVSAVLTILATAASINALPSRHPRLSSRQAQAAKDLNAKFAAAKAGDACNGEVSCVGDQLGQCVNGKVVASACAPGTICRAVPLVNAVGTSVVCTTQADFDQRINAPDAASAGGAANNGAANNNNNNNGAQNNAGNNNNGNNNGNNNNGGAAAGGAAAGGDPQTSTTLDPSVIAAGFNNNGQDPPVAGQTASLTSTNNFINFCVGKTITDGKQIKEGSCNPCPIGDIPSFDNMPSAKFLFPPNNDATIKANAAFTVKMNIQKMQTGVFVNAQKNYFAAPQQLNGQGQIIGHTHVTIETLPDGVTQTTPLDSRDFVFFKGINDAAAGGVASAAVDDGLPAGAYRVCSINSSSNHQPVIVPVAQHGSLDDCSYFTVTA